MPVLQVRATVVAVAPVPVFLAAVLLGYVRSGVTDPQAFGLLVAGTSTTLCAGAALVLHLTHVRRAPRGTGPEGWRVAGLGSLVVCGLGLLAFAAEAAQGRTTGVTPGTVLLWTSVVLATSGILAVPRATWVSRPMLRLALEALVLGSAAALSFWFVWGARLGDGTADLRQGADRLAMLGVALVLLALCLLLWLRDVRSALVPGVVGLAANVLAQLLVVLASVTQAGGGRVVPWQASLLWTLAWPAVTAAALFYRPPTAEEADPDRASRQEELATHVTTALAVGVLVVGLVLDTTTGPSLVTQILSILLVVAIAAREVVSTRIRHEMTAGLRRQALTDPLTGLANRRALTAAITRAGEDAVLLTLDLDGFKRVNDLLGHAAGDDLLVRVADALVPVCPPDALVARIGGDEFAVLCPGDLTTGRAVAERLRDAVTEVVHAASGLGLAVSVGVGRLVDPDAGAGERPAGTDDDGAGRGGPRAEPRAERRDRLEALAESGAALRAAKHGGRDQVVVYGGAIAVARRRRLAVERRLRAALADGRVEVVAQPVVDVRTRTVRGFEALARWTDPEVGVVAPEEFVAVAEEAGLVVPLGEHVLRRAVARATALGVFDRGQTVGVNVSPVQLRSPGFDRVVAGVLAEHAVPPAQLALEVTETLLIEADGPAVHTLGRLADLGVTIAVDDYGTGYSSLSYLLRFPVHVLKIDRSLVTSSLDDPRARAVVESVVEVAGRLGLLTVLEGVETEQLAEHGARLGAPLQQGWLYGRAVPWSSAVAHAALRGGAVGAQPSSSPSAAPVPPALPSPATPHRWAGTA